MKFNDYVFIIIIIFITVYCLELIINQAINKVQESIPNLNQLESLINKAERYENLIASVERRCDEINCIDLIMDFLENRTVRCIN